LKKALLLIRHAESIKNTKKQLSSDIDKEVLTVRGQQQAELLASNVQKFTQICGLQAAHVYCAESARAINTGKYIADVLGVDVLAYPQFKSFVVGIHAGKKEADIGKTDPLFISNLTLYRKSLLNSYDIIYQGSKETLQQYEYCASSALRSIIENDEGNCKIVIMHRSALTATLLDIARRYYKYPSDFYGYVQINLATVSLIEIDSDSMAIHFACEDSKKLLSTGISKMNNLSLESVDHERC
jgi:broad specificity phosphatase PhoE